MIPPILYFLIMIFVIIGIMFYRNEIVYKARIRSNKITSDKAKEWIHFCAEKQDIEQMKRWIEFHDKRESYGSYDKMMFDFRKWSYEKFFPGFDDFSLKDE